MRFLDKRAEVICRNLQKLQIKQREVVTDWQYKEGFYLHPEDTQQDGGSFIPFSSEKDHWYGPDKHYWFKGCYEVTEEFDGKPLWLHISTQHNHWADGDPQFLFFKNGVPLQGVDGNHSDILIENKAKKGTNYTFEFQAYSGRPANELKFMVEAQELDPEITGLYYDLKVPLEGLSRLEKDDQNRLALIKVLNATVNLIDFRKPYSEAFYSSIYEARNYIDQALYTDLANANDVIATCIGHTHIDVAWLWTLAQTKEKVARSFATVLKLMDEYPNYRFMSSQPQLYQFLKERYPELYEKIKEKINDSIWEPEGGMWLEADCNLTSGESLVRQFLYGKQFFKDEFGVDNKILWLPDVFGYSGALPQIMKKSGIDYFMTTKVNWNQFNKIPNDTFKWKGIDGSEVLTHLITTLDIGQSEDNFFTTYNGQLHPDALLGGWKRYQNKDINNDILISYGYGDGGGGPTRQMLETSKRMEKGIKGLPKVRQEFSRKYFDELNERVKDDPRLATWEGELYFEYHRGTLTSMARNKRSNRKAEFGLMDLELLSVLAKNEIEYPKKDLDEIWKIVLKNQFHDILPGSAIHDVYEVSKQEYQQVQEKIETLTSERIDQLIEEDDAELTIFNTTGFNRDDIVVLPIVKANSLCDSEGHVFPVQKLDKGGVVHVNNLPSKGYKSLHWDNQVCEDNCFTLDDKGIETPFYKVVIDQNGYFTSIYDKQNNRETVTQGELANLFRMYEDKPMNFDDWDIDIYYTEKFWDVTDLSKSEWIEKGPVRATLYQERNISSSIIRQKIHFYRDSRRIDFETTVDWKENQHLLKVHFPVAIHNDEATYDIQFGNLKRRTNNNTSWEIAQFEACGQKWVDLSEGHYGVSLLNDSKYGHSIKDGNIGLTLIKSGIDPNPVADQEMHIFSYALYPHAEGWQEAKTVPEAYFFNQPAIAKSGKTSKESFSFVESSAKNVVIETIKVAEDGNGIIVRVYETENALTQATLCFPETIKSAEECDLMEEKINEIDSSTDELTFSIAPYEIKSFRIIL